MSEEENEAVTQIEYLIEEAYIKMGNAFRDPETGELYVLKKSEEKEVGHDSRRTDKRA